MTLSGVSYHSAVPRPVPPTLRTAARRFAGIRLELALALGRDPTDAEVWAEFRRWDVRAAERAFRMAMRRDRGPKVREGDGHLDGVAVEANAAEDGDIETAERLRAELGHAEPEPVDLGLRLRRSRR